jgi:histidinol-phosphate aminotransferase
MNIDFSEQDSLISLIKSYNNLIVSQTFSKAWGLAGARVGSAYANNQIISLYSKIKPPYNVSSLNQEAVLNALEDYDNYKKTIALLLKEKKKLQIELGQIDLIKKIYPSDANFILIEVDNADKLYEQLLEQKIIVRNRSKQIPNTLRITIGTSQENQKLIETLNSIA